MATERLGEIVKGGLWTFLLKEIVSPPAPVQPAAAVADDVQKKRKAETAKAETAEGRRRASIQVVSVICGILPAAPAYGPSRKKCGAMAPPRHG